MDPTPPPVMNPGVDLAELLRHRITDTGELIEAAGGLRIKVFHAGGFPWGEVFKILLYRNFRVQVTHHKADLFIEASL